MAATRQLTQQVSDIIMNDPSIMKSIVSAVSQLIVEKIVESDEVVEKIKNKVTKDTTFLESVTKKLYDKQDTMKQELYDSVSHDYAQLTYKHEKLEKAFEILSRKHSDLEWEIDSLEQYGRRNCLLFHNIPEPRLVGKQRENTDNTVLSIIKEKLELDLDTNDFDRSHRLGRKGFIPPGGEQNADGVATKPRPIIVKFISYNVRSEVFRHKRALKGSGLGITESLTQKRLELYKSVSKHANVLTVWTQDGRITCLLKSNKKVIIDSTKDLYKLQI